jgi:hypothetical protein
MLWGKFASDGGSPAVCSRDGSGGKGVVLVGGGGGSFSCGVAVMHMAPSLVSHEILRLKYFM